MFFHRLPRELVPEIVDFLDLSDWACLFSTFKSGHLLTYPSIQRAKEKEWKTIDKHISAVNTSQFFSKKGPALKLQQFYSLLTQTTTPFGLRLLISFKDDIMTMLMMLQFRSDTKNANIRRLVLLAHENDIDLPPVLLDDWILPGEYDEDSTFARARSQWLCLPPEITHDELDNESEEEEDEQDDHDDQEEEDQVAEEENDVEMEEVG